MSSAQFMSQQSNDLDIYLPSEIDLEDELIYSSPDMLTHSIDFSLPSSAHRMDSEIFDPINDDMAASSTLTITEFDMNDVCHYLHERSTVVPHIPKESLAVSPSSTNSNSMSPPPGSPTLDIRKFLIYDKVTGRERRPLLYEFIRLLLDNDEYSYIAEYIDRKKGIFKLHRPKVLSELWKHVKGRNSDNKMTYDKLARAIRYYYSGGIMASSPGRFTFRFGPKSGFGTAWWPSYK